MARLRANPDDLIGRLEAALEVAKPNDVVGATDIAAIVKMTWRNLLLTHIEPDAKFPIQKRGAEGISWEFRVVRVLKHMLKRAHERKAMNEQRARRLMELTGFSVPQSDEAMDIADITRLIDANAKARAEKTEQGRYVPAETVRLFVSGYNRLVCSELLRERQKQDPTGFLPPDIAEAIDEHMRDLALTIHEKATRFVEDFSEASRPGGTT